MKWLIIARKEVKVAFRDRLFMLLAVIIWLLLGLSAWNGFTSYAMVKEQRIAAQRLFKGEWDELEANPHSAAHFGTFLYKPFNILSLIDNGLNSYTGTEYQIEAHKQHDVNYSIAEDTDSTFRFAELTGAAVMQLLIPLLIIFLGFSGVSREKEGGTLSMLRIHGCDQRTLLIGKIAAHYSLLLLILLPFILLIGARVLINQETSGIGIRLSILLLVYLSYFFIHVTIVNFISAFSRSSAASLLTNLSVWLLFCIIIPRMAPTSVEKGLELPSRFELSRRISEGYLRGVDGDKSYNERAQDFRKAMLAKYNVDSLSQMPVNMGGLVLQNSEDYNSKVYRRYSAEVEGIIVNQQKRLQLVGLFDPFIAVQQLSMGVSGADYFHHLAFHHQARDYRDDFIRTLNMDLAQNGLKAGYKADKNFFRSMPAFTYQLPSVTTMSGWQKYSILGLLAWVLLTTMALLFFSNQLKIPR